MRIPPHLTILFCIIALGFFLRVYNLSGVPAGFFADEASIGYNAYTILTRGSDEYGTPYPIFFRAFGEYKNPVQIYSTVPFVALFGLNEFSIRLPSAIFGTLAILAIFYLSLEIFRNYPQRCIISLLVAFFLAISPWHTHLSRISMEGISAFALFTTLSIYLFLKKKLHLFYLGIVASALAFYSYFPARAFIPPIILGTAIIFHKKLPNRQHLLIGLTLFSVLLLPFIPSMFSQTGTARWQQVSIFSHPPQNQTVSAHIINNYLSHFSYQFLFEKGDAGMPGQHITRHSLRDFGQLYLFQLPLLFLGLFGLVKNRSWQILSLILLWFLLYPLGSMFTTDKNAQATRSFIGIIPFQILSAWGFIFLLSLFKKRLLKWATIGILTFLAVFSSSVYLQHYFTKYPLYSSDFWGWQYGPREIVPYFLSVRDHYDDLYLNGEFNAPEIFLKFYDPKNLCLSKCKIGGLNQYDPPRRQLFALSPGQLSSSNLQYSFILQKAINYPNGQQAFLIGEIGSQN